MAENKFKQLYEYCQTITPKVSRKHILKKTLEITKVDKVASAFTTLDTTICRGMFISAKNTEHKFVKLLGCDVILLARGQKYCWQRFIYTKELMHLFDQGNEPTDSADKFERLLTELEAPPTGGTISEQTISESNGFWMALTCLCPEKSRLDFESLRDKGHIDDYGIALQLRIPEQHVPQLFHPRYKELVESLIK